jgi:hypothetical protein
MSEHNTHAPSSACHHERRTLPLRIFEKCARKPISRAHYCSEDSVQQHDQRTNALLSFVELRSVPLDVHHRGVRISREKPSGAYVTPKTTAHIPAG